MHPSRALPALLLTAALSVGGALALAPGAAAQSAVDATCAGPVLDEASSAGVLNLDQAPALDAAIVQTRAEIGAVVVIATFDRVPGGDLDAAVDRLIEDCPALQRPNGAGGRADRLLVLALSTGDRVSGMYFGSDYNETLGPDDAQDRVLSEIEDGFSDQRTTEGFTSALGEVRAIVQDEGFPTGRVVGGVAGLAALGGLGYGGLRLRRRQQETSAARTAAAQAAEQASVRFVELDQELGRTLLGVDAMLAGIDESSTDDDELRVLRADVVTSTEAALTAWTGAQQAQQERPEPVTGMSAERARTAKRDSAALLGLLDDGVARLQPVAERVRSMEGLVAGLPADLSGRKAEVGRARQALADAAAQGWHVAALGARIDTAEQQLQQARGDLDAHRPVTAGAARDRAAAGLEAVAQETAQLPARREAVLARAGALEGGLPGARARTEVAAATLTALAADFADQDSADVRGSSVTAHGLLDEVTASVPEIRRLGSMAVQDFGAAEQAADTAEAAAAQAAGLLEAVETRQTRLVRLRAELPARTATAIARARELGRLLVDIGADGDRTAPGRALTAGQRARTVETTLSMPGRPLLAMDERLRGAEDDLALVETEARRAHEQEEQVRTQAQQGVEAVRRSVSDADAVLSRGGGVSAGAHDRGRSASDALRRAEELLAEALVVGGGVAAREVVRLAGQAAQDADAARRTAEEDLERERRAREDEERRRRVSRRSSYSGGSGGSRRSGGGGSRRSSGGGSRRSGGGSRRF